MGLVRLVSSILAIWLFACSHAAAHEILPSIADMTEQDGRLTFDVRLNVEAFVAGIDLSVYPDTDSAPQAELYDELRALSPAELDARFRQFWPAMAGHITIDVGGFRPALTLIAVEIAETGNVEVNRASQMSFSADLPAAATVVRVGWSAKYGALVLRQMGVEAPYDGYLENGAISEPIALVGGSQASVLETFLRYCAVGFDHIIPKGLDHVLFVLGLFFLAARLRPLFWQVSAFTLAHTVTLAASVLGYVSVPANIVEPIIALSIAYVAVENMISDRLRRWRPVIIFCFGLLHGLGFAGVLKEFGLPDASFITALIGFNVGVELGQLAVIAVAFLAVGIWFRNKAWYRTAISIPCSALIALTGAYWFVERTIL